MYIIYICGVSRSCTNLRSMLFSSLSMFNEPTKDHRHYLQITHRHNPFASAVHSLSNAVGKIPLALSGITPERLLSYIR